MVKILSYKYNDCFILKNSNEKEKSIIVSINESFTYYVFISFFSKLTIFRSKENNNVS